MKKQRERKVFITKKKKFLVIIFIPVLISHGWIWILLLFLLLFWDHFSSDTSILIPTIASDFHFHPLKRFLLLRESLSKSSSSSRESRLWSRPKSWIVSLLEERKLISASEAGFWGAQQKMAKRGYKIRILFL